MQYSILTPDQLPLAAQLIDESGYYSPVQLDKLGGMVVGGWDGEKLVTSLWVALTGHRAYLDYVVAHHAHKGASVRLLLKGKAMLCKLGISEVVFHVHPDNEEVIRIAQVFGTEFHGAHVMCSANIGDCHGN